MRIINVPESDEIGLIVTPAELQFLSAQVGKHTGLSAYNHIKNYPTVWGKPLYEKPKVFRDKVYSALRDAFNKHAYKRSS